MFAEGFVPSRDFKGSRIILQGHDAERSAIFFCKFFLHSGEKSGESEAARFGHGKSLGDAPIRGRLEAAAVVVERMARDIEAK